MFRLGCQRGLTLGTFQPFLTGWLNLVLRKGMSFIGGELNDVLWVANRLSHRVLAMGSFFTLVSQNPKFRFRPSCGR